MFLGFGLDSPAWDPVPKIHSWVRRPPSHLHRLYSTTQFFAALNLESLGHHVWALNFESFSSKNRTRYRKKTCFRVLHYTWRQKNMAIYREYWWEPHSVNVLKFALFCSRTPQINCCHTHCPLWRKRDLNHLKTINIWTTMNKRKIYMQTLENRETKQGKMMEKTRL